MKNRGKPTLKQTRIIDPHRAMAQNLTDWLTEDECRLADTALSPHRRTDWIAARIAVKSLLRDDFGIAPLLCQLSSDGIAPVCHHASAANINISLSHSAGTGAASWAETQTEGTVGIDFQHIRPVKTGLASRILSPRELSQWDGTHSHLLLFWSLKEAGIKARRQAWGRRLNEISVELGQDGEAVLTLPGEIATFAAQYARLEMGWVARAVRPVTFPQSDATEARRREP